MAAHQAPPSLGFSRQEHWSGLPFPSPVHESEKWKWSRSVVSDPQWPHGLQPSRLLHPWDFPGRSTGVGCHCLLRKLGQSCGKQYGAFSKKLRIGLPYDPAIPLRGIYLQKTQSSAFKRLINQSKQKKEGTEMIPCKLLMLFTYFCISVIFFLLIKNTYIVIWLKHYCILRIFLDLLFVLYFK